MSAIEVLSRKQLTNALFGHTVPTIVAPVDPAQRERLIVAVDPLRPILALPDLKRKHLEQIFFVGMADFAVAKGAEMQQQGGDPPTLDIADAAEDILNRYRREFRRTLYLTYATPTLDRYNDFSVMLGWLTDLLLAAWRNAYFTLRGMRPPGKLAVI